MKIILFFSYVLYIISFSLIFWFLLYKPPTDKASTKEARKAVSTEEGPKSTLLKIGRKITPKGLLEQIQRQIVLAGMSKSLSLDTFITQKMLSAITSATIAILILWFLGISFFKLLTWLILITVAGFFIPDLLILNKAQNRQKQMRLELPDILDMLTVSVEAGLGFDAALWKVVQNSKGPLAEEFFRLLREIQLGTSRHEAFRNLNKRTKVEELNSFILAMLQADTFGVSIGKVLRIQAKEMRIKRRQLAEEKAMKTPVKIIFPLVLCIFPALVIVILGPAGIKIMESLSQLGR